MAIKGPAPRIRKRKVLARLRAAEKGTKNEQQQQQDQEPLPPPDRALDVILPAEAKEREEKKAALRRELLAASAATPKVSAKKAKRLEKYIDAKLRKDETRELLSRLAASRIDTSLFASTRDLGQARETRRQALGRGLREERAGLEIGREEREGLLFEPGRGGRDDGGESESEGVGKDEEAGAPSCSVALKRPLPASVGSGLKRPLELDGDEQPVLKKRRKRGGVKTKGSATKPKPDAPIWSEEEESGDDDNEDGDNTDNNKYPEWEGLSSDDDKSPAVNNGHLEEGDPGTESEKEEGDPDSESEKEGGDTGSGSEKDEGDPANESEREEGEGASDYDGEGESASESEEEEADDRQERSSAFKAWARQKRNEALGYETVAADPATTAFPNMPQPTSFTPRPAEVDQEELPPELRPTTNTDRRVFSVPVSRTAEIEQSRLRLPIMAEEHRLMESIHDNDTVVICGATGSGKTTQVPQFLFEAGYGAKDSDTPGIIGVTQPRRVAAVSTSRRVAEELGSQHGARVGYQIRFEGTAAPRTAIKFMTDGVLLRELAQDIALRRYSAVVVDEAHERSVSTDILIGMLSRVVRLRRDLAAEDPSVRPLKLIIMSATLRVEDVTENRALFQHAPPVLEVEGRQHPVTVHFSRQTRHDYVEEAFRKVRRGHRRLPPGGMLVFLTGEGEIRQLRRRLEAEFGGQRSEGSGVRRVRVSASEAPVEVEDLEFGQGVGGGGGVLAGEEEEEAEMADDDDGDDGEDDEFNIPQEDEDGIGDQHQHQHQPGPTRIHVLPLYSQLPTREQLRVFEPAPPGSRLVVLTTNVAETSVTIPGVRYVFDAGRAKERRLNPVTGVQTYEVGWISQASANQRAGRAGRTGPGHCYRLYSSAVYEAAFAEFATPELLRTPIEGVVLQLKAMNLQNVVNFPFPTPPPRDSLVRAERLLTCLGAVGPPEAGPGGGGQVTAVGRTMAVFPLAPRFARILLVGHLHDCIHYVVTMVAALSAPEVFVPESQVNTGDGDGDENGGGEGGDERRHHNSAADVRRRRFAEVHRNFGSLDDRSDALKLMQAAAEFAHEPTEEWCDRHFVRHKALRETQLLRRQITDLLASNIPAHAGLRFRDRLPRPEPRQILALKQMVAAGFIDQIAIRADLAPNQPADRGRKPRRAIEVPYVPLTPIVDGKDGDPHVYVHPSSPLARLSPAECPEYVVYGHLQRGAAASSRTRMHALTDVTGAQVASLARGTPLLTYGKPVKEASLDEAGRRRECWVVPYLRGEGGGGVGWALPLRRVVQRKTADRGWVEER